MQTILGRGIAAAAGAALCLLAAALPASAAPSASSHPTVKYFRASPVSLASAGGSVRLSAAVKGASVCDFTSSPRLSGLPAKVSCSRGSAARTIRLPGNSAAGQQAYKFGLTISGHGGKITARPVTVVVREAPPAVSPVTAAPSSLPSAGGTTVLTAMVSRSSKCTVSATPSVADLPAATACVAGATPAEVSIPISLPALAGATAQQYQLTLTVSGPGGTSSTLASATVQPPSVQAAMTFSAPVQVDTPAGWLGTVSCVSSTFCMGLDLASGAAESWNGTSWSVPVRIETGAYLDDGYNMHLSCASASFCLAVDTSGNAFAFNGASWSPVAGIGLDAATVSCASPTFCVAAGGSQAAIFSGSSWSAPVNVASNDQIVSVSCPSDSFCMAVTEAGMAYTYSSSGWDTGTAFDTPIESVQVSCASATFCAAVTDSGTALTYNGTWSAPALLNAGEPMYSVSCPAGTTFCLAFSDGSFYTTDGTTWTGANSVVPGTPMVASCASATYCLATDGQQVFVVDGTTWTSSPAPGSPLHGFPYAISCPTASFCLAVDWSGAYLTYNGATWSTPQAIGPQAREVDAVSCSSPAFCMAVDASDANGLGGNVFTFNGHTWQFEGQDGLPLSSVSCTGPDFCEMLTYETDGTVATATWNGQEVLNTQVLDAYLGFGPAPTIGFLSCPTSTFCVAVDQLGNAFTFNGASWSTATALDPGVAAALTGVSCPTTTFCVAIDAGGHEYTYNAGTWSTPVTIDTTGQPQAISCTSSQFCLMGDLSGNVATFNGTTWSAASDVDPTATAGTGLTGASCADATDCVAVDWEGNAIVGTG